MTQANKKSTTCLKDTIQSIPSFTHQKDLQIIDIITAFLKIEYISRNAFVTAPPEGNCLMGYNNILKKCLYDLSDASLKWYFEVWNFPINNSGTASSADPALFLWYNEKGELIGCFHLHVSNFIFAGSQKNEALKFNMKLKSSFSAGQETLNSWHILIELLHNNQSI